jgi:hypothetical protein
MTTTIASQRNDILIRGHILEPGEALPWHTDLCHRVVVTIRGDRLRTEYRDSGETETVALQPGAMHWSTPQPRVHRAVNVGAIPYEKVVVFFLSEPGMEPEPEVK